MAEAFWAHSGGARPHLLEEHLREVGRRAAANARAFGPVWGQLAGQWHDLGKYRRGFQDYIRLTSDAHIEGKLPRRSDKSHSAAGALHAIDVLGGRFGADGERAGRLLAYVIAGHHAGLADWTAGLDTRLFGTGATDSNLEFAQAKSACEAAAPELLDLPSGFSLRDSLLALPGIQSDNPLAWSLAVRMIFSALVDADFLDTETYFDEGKALARQQFAPIATYRDRLAAALQRKSEQVQAAGRGDDPVMRARRAVLTNCRDAARLAHRVFSLEVPTGGGKTLSSLAFALDHAVAHGKRRVVYAIPYTSIIEQTADVFAEIFGADAIVEHHSQADASDGQETAATRLACEKWDAPLIVTTNVQLFESLFAARTSRCRKLHNLADSVIVLDEAQLLPPEHLQPILDTLRLLVDHYGVTLLLCTATQPVLTSTQRFDPRAVLRGLPTPVPIVAERDALYASLERVSVDWPADLRQEVELPDVAARMARDACALSIVNTRKDAAALVAAVDIAAGTRALHLSAAMCGQHRADVITEIRARLDRRRDTGSVEALHVVSTQLVEAGVDVDFPVVYRALAGLDSIAQAAGRCNREGRLDGKGRVVVFARPLPRPLHTLRFGVQSTIAVLGDTRPSTLLPHHFERYFTLYYNEFGSRDAKGVVELLRNRGDFAMSFRSAAEAFRLIDDEDQVSVVVPYESPNAGARSLAPLLARLRRGDCDRWLLRAVQRFTVQVRRRIVDGWLTRGAAIEVLPGIVLLQDELMYDNRLGLLNEGQPLSAEVLVQ